MINWQLWDLDGYLILVAILPSGVVMVIADSIPRYMLVWNYFKSTYDYTMWTTYCEELVRLFSQYESVEWDCHSFKFTIRFTEADWIAVDMLSPPGQRHHVTAHDYYMWSGHSHIWLSMDEFISDIRECV